MLKEKNAIVNGSLKYCKQIDIKHQKAYTIVSAFLPLSNSEYASKANNNNKKKKISMVSYSNNIKDYHTLSVYFKSFTSLFMLVIQLSSFL